MNPAHQRMREKQSRVRWVKPTVKTTSVAGFGESRAGFPLEFTSDFVASPNDVGNRT